jgi:hypothetical protein
MSEPHQVTWVCDACLVEASDIEHDCSDLAYLTEHQQGRWKYERARLCRNCYSMRNALTVFAQLLDNALRKNRDVSARIYSERDGEWVLVYDRLAAVESLGALGDDFGKRLEQARQALDALLGGGS